jgi:hypothetical protein
VPAQQAKPVGTVTKGLFHVKKPTQLVGLRRSTLARLGAVFSRKVLTAAVCLVAALGFAFYAFHHPMDYRVYFYGARGVFEGTRPVYGLNSGLGWPMHYRYPPLFLLLFTPFAILPLAWGAAVWVLLKIAVLGLLLKQVFERRLRPAATSSTDRVLAGGGPLTVSPRSLVVPALFIAPYLVEDFRYGNAQFFIFALSVAALLLIDKRPVLSGASLALGISVKVWPLFFVPYLAVRRKWREVGYTLAFVGLFALLPAFYFGFSGNLGLLGEWFTQEGHTQLSESEIWFPNQSLRGELMRYLTAIDYSQVPDSNYAQVNILSLNASLVKLIWLVFSIACYAGFLGLANRRRHTPDWLGQGLAFCLIAILEPFTQKYAIVILFWPAIILASTEWKPERQYLLYLAAVLALVQPLTPGANTQRLLQVLGLDFAAAALVTAVFAIACLE